jgi:hypothetical protein
VKTKKHKTVVGSRASKNTISSYLQAKSVGEMERQLAAQEATLAFHTVVHNRSFRSMGCTTAIVKTLFNQKLTCCQTKPRRLSQRKVSHHIKYYHPEKCVMVKALELVSLGGETSEPLASYVLEFLRNLNLMTK